jgi:hypothetical protein
MIKKAVFLFAIFTMVFAALGVKPVFAAGLDNYVTPPAKSVAGYVACVVTTLPQARALKAQPKAALEKVLSDAVNAANRMILPALVGMRQGLIAAVTVTVLTRHFGYYSSAYPAAAQACMKYI